MTDQYRLRGYTVAPLSIKDIRNTAGRAREVLQMSDKQVQAERFLEGLFMPSASLSPGLHSGFFGKA